MVIKVLKSKNDQLRRGDGHYFCYFCYFYFCFFLLFLVLPLDHVIEHENCHAVTR